MKYLRLFLLILSIISVGKISNAQNGFLITQSGQKIIGYLRHEVDFMTGQQEIELWETKKDLSPKRFKLSSLKEYKIDKEHVKIFDTFYPFENQDIAFADLKVKVITIGKVNLYSSVEIETSIVNIPVMTIGAGGIPTMHGGRSNAIKPALCIRKSITCLNTCKSDSSMSF